MTFSASRASAANPIEFEGPVRGLTLCSPHGFVLFVSPRYPHQESSVWFGDGRSSKLFAMTADQPSEELALQPGSLRLPSGRHLNLAEGSMFAMMLPYQFKIDEHCQIDYANATLLGCGGTADRRVLILRGEAGRTGIISINGHETSLVFAAGDPVSVNAGGVTVLGVSRELADRTWFADGRILMGPSYVGEQSNGKHECWFDRGPLTVHTISAQGEFKRAEVPAHPLPSGLIQLKKWRAKALPEIKGEGDGWREIGRPKPVEELGAYYGYSWYAASIDSDEERSSALLFTQAADRFHVFRNGERVGVWGRGPQATRDPLPVQLERRENRFVFLCDNMGRLSEGKCQDRKGILGNVYLDAVAIPLGEGEWFEVKQPPSETWEFRTYRCFSETPQGRFSRIRFRVSVGEGNGALLALRWIPQYAWLHINSRPVGEHGGDCPLISGLCFSEFILDQYLSAGETEIDLTFCGEPIRDWSDHVFLFSYPLQRALTGWKFKPWQDPVEEGKVLANAPTWWESEFGRPDIPGPLFWATQGLSKGQAYLNGRALGRYWEIGPQHSLYLPEPWLEQNNRLTVFDEVGKQPNQTYIMRDLRYPAHKLLI